jgi:hypothetical protein
MSRTITAWAVVDDARRKLARMIHPRVAEVPVHVVIRDCYIKAHPDAARPGAAQPGIQFVIERCQIDTRDNAYLVSPGNYGGAS